MDEESGGCSVTRTTQVFKDCLLSCPIRLTPALSLRVSTYITQTLLQHFNLYFFLVNYTQQENLTDLDMMVDTAEKNLPPLHFGIELSEWEKREKVREIEEKNTLKENALHKSRELSIKEEKMETEMVEESILQALQSSSSNGVSEKDI